MRVILDTNIFISALVTTNDSSPIIQILEAASEGQFTLLLPSELFEEFIRTIIEKKRFRKKVTVVQVETLVGILARVGEIISPIAEKITPGREYYFWCDN